MFFLKKKLFALDIHIPLEAWIGDKSVQAMEKAMAPHSSTFAWKIPWTVEPGRVQSMGSLRVRHD